MSEGIVLKKKPLKSGKIVTNFSTGITRLLLDILFYTLVIFAVVKFTQYGYNFCYQLFGSVAVDKAGEGTEVEFFIQSGDSTKEVANKLEREGIVIDKLSFYVKSLLSKSNIQPGTYILRSDMDYDTILNTICRYKETENTEEDD